MKNNTLFLLSFILAVNLQAQVAWQKMASLPGPGRNHAIGFSHGTKGYVMTGESAARMKDFWEYDSGSDTWTQLPDYPGAARSYGVGYVVGDKAYIGLGSTSSGYVTDWWAYDFNTSTWTQKSNFPGVGRNHPACAEMNGKIYMGFGDNSSGSLKDWWQYDPNLDQWAQKTQYPGLKMHHPVTAQYNGLIYVSEGHLKDGTTNTGSVDFYYYNTGNDTWTQLANMPGPGVVAGASFYIGNNKVYSGSGITEPAGAFHQEWYAYDLTGGTWSQIANYPGLGVFGPVSFTIGNEGYVVTGQDVNGNDSQDLYKLYVQVAQDAGSPSITSPSGSMCTATFTPTVIIKNYGTATLTTCTVNFRVDAAANQTYAWSGSLATNATAAVTLPAQTVSAGTHTFTCFTSNPNGNTDGNANNDQSQSVFSFGASNVLPLVQGFEGSSSIPSGWSLYNPNSDAAWQVSTSVARTGTNSVGFNNCNGDGNTDMTGRKDRLITPAYDFSNIASASMTFDVAYAMLYYQSVAYGDTLAVYYSTNCGATWTRVYYKGGSVLASAPQVTSVSSCWSPTSSQWRNDAITLNQLAGQPNVMFAFEDISMWGEWVYLDNINITGTLGIPEINALSEINVYPNPASSYFNVEGMTNSQAIRYSLSNALGQVVASGEFVSSGHNFTGQLQVNDLAKGIYLLRLNDETSTATKKVTIQ